MQPYPGLRRETGDEGIARLDARQQLHVPAMNDRGRAVQEDATAAHEGIQQHGMAPAANRYRPHCRDMREEIVDDGF